MIAKLECFLGHCHIPTDWLGLALLFPVWTILCAQLCLPLLFLEIPNPRLLNFPRNRDETILLLIFSSLLCLIHSHFLITKYFILYMLSKEKLGVDNQLGLKGLP